MIELKNIKKVYRSKKSSSTNALNDISLTLGNKGLTFILGKSGSGKSTLLNIIGGLDTPTEGEVIIRGKSMKDFKEKDYDAYRNTSMGFIFQEYNLIDSYNVMDNVRISLELSGTKVSEEEVKKVLKRVGLEGYEKRRTNELSGGQRQRIAIARALIKNPDIILADEPTGNLDSETSKSIFELLKEISKTSLVVVVSHDDESARKYGDRIIKIVDGKIISDTLPETHNIKEEYVFKDSKLPLKYSLKMGLSNLLYKKSKMFFSCIALIICFLSLGITISILDYELETEVIKAFEKNGGTEVKIQKYNGVVDWSKYVSNMISSTDIETMEDLLPSQKSLDENFVKEANDKTSLNFLPSYSMYSEEGISMGELRKEDTALYYAALNVISVTPSDYLNQQSLLGNIPTNKNEIVITSYLAENIIYNGIKAQNDIKGYQEEFDYKPSSFDEIIKDEKYIKINNLGYFKITGILTVETKKYEDLKTISTEDTFAMEESGKDINDIFLKFSSLHSEVSYKRIYVTNDLINEQKEKINNISYSIGEELVIYKSNYIYLYEIDGKYGFLLGKEDIYNNKGSMSEYTLKNDEVIININFLKELNSDYETKLKNYLENNKDKTEKDYLPIYLENNSIIGSTLKSNISEGKIYIYEKNYKEYKIAGVILDEKVDGIIYFSKDNIDDLIKDSISLEYIYTYAKDSSVLKDILKVYPLDKSDTIATCTYSSNLVELAFIISILNSAGKYATIVFIVVSILLMMNFISNSIKFRKKEIGILRALGCKGIDVSKMFVFETVLLCLVSLVVACIFMPSIGSGFNETLKLVAFTSFEVVNFGIKQIVILFVVSILVSIIISLFPVIKVTRQKPIDTILDK